MTESTEDTEELYPFSSDEEGTISDLLYFLTSLLKDPHIKPSQIAGLACMIHAVERFPLVTPGIDCGLSLVYRSNGEVHCFQLEINDRTFEIHEVQSGIPPKTWVEYPVDERAGGGEGNLVMAIEWLKQYANDSLHRLSIYGAEELFPNWDIPIDDTAWDRLEK